MIKTRTISSVILLACTIFVNSAFASHPLPELDPFSTSHEYICYQTNKLNSVQVDDETGQGALVKSESEDARAHVSSKTDMTLTYASTCSVGYSIVSAKWMSSHIIASTSGLYGSGPYEYKIISFNTNSNVNLDTSSICTGNSDPPPEFVANHEFGHLVGLGHAEWYDAESHTMMKSTCGHGYASIKQDDIDQVNDMY